MKVKCRFTRLLGAAVLATFAAVPVAQAEWPEKPIRVVVPYPAGVGSTTAMANAFTVAITDGKYLPQPMQVVHVPGAGGSIGSRQVKNAAPDGYTILAYNDSLASSKALGIVDYGQNAFEPIASVGKWCGMVLVPASSPYKSLAELLDDVRARPDTVTQAVGIGTVSHLSALVFANAMGIKPRLVSAGGPATRMPQIAGGHIDFTLSATNSYLQFKELGVRSLAMLAPERNSKAPDIATAKEQGINAPDYCGTIYFLAPKGTPAAILAKLEGAFRQALNHPVAKNALDKAAMDTEIVAGEDFKRDLIKIEREFDEIAAKHPEVRQKRK